MPVIKVTSADLESLSSQVTGRAEDINTTLTTLGGQVQAVAGVEWQGQANQAFQELYDDWQRSAKGLHEALSKISTLLSSAAHNYAQTETAIAGSMGH